MSPILRTACAVILGAATLLGAPAAYSQAFDIEGRYEVIAPPQPVEDPATVEVVDVFWYGCPHCWRFLPEMEAYEKSKPDYVTIRRMPAVFRESWVAHARAFYTAKMMGKADELHRPIFEAIHQDKARLATREALMAFFGEHGVPKEDFAKHYDSFSVESQVRKSIQMQQAYGVTGTPSVIVNGKYRVSARLAGSYPNMIKVMDALAAKEHEARLAAQ